MRTIHLHGPNSKHQRELITSPARHKIGRWGRRAGKTVCAFDMAVGGHGSNWDAGMGSATPQWKGIVHGYDVLWIGRSHKQARGIWFSEVKPRFEAAGGKVNDSDFIASLPGMGRLIVCSQDRDSINNARGLGDRVIGVIGDEVAHWDDAEAVWLEILVPMLADNMAWSLFISTTEPGSWFNDLCEQVTSGERGADWFHNHATAQHNPRITPAAFAAMVREYPAGDPRLKKEVYAELTAGGGGLAFPEWRTDLHVAEFAVPREWRWVAGMDWGYTSPGAVVFAACGPDDRVHFAREYTFQEKEPYEVGLECGLFIRDHAIPIEWIVADRDPVFSTIQGPETIAEHIQRGLQASLGRAAPPFSSVEKGPGTPLTRKMLMHQGLAYTTDPNDPDGQRVPPWSRPKWTFSARGCANLVRTLPKLLLDSRGKGSDKVTLETVKKDGREHWFDAATYMAISRTPDVESQEPDVPEHVHPGYLPNGERRSRERSVVAQIEEQLRQQHAEGRAMSGRYGTPPGPRSRYGPRAG